MNKIYSSIQKKNNSQENLRPMFIFLCKKPPIHEMFTEDGQTLNRN